MTARYAFMFAFTASAVIGNERIRAPQALKIALPSAGAITVTAGLMLAEILARRQLEKVRHRRERD